MIHIRTNLPLGLLPRGRDIAPITIPRTRISASFRLIPAKLTFMVLILSYSSVVARERIILLGFATAVLPQAPELQP